MNTEYFMPFFIIMVLVVCFDLLIRIKNLKKKLKQKTFEDESWFKTLAENQKILNDSQKDLANAYINFLKKMTEEIEPKDND